MKRSTPLFAWASVANRRALLGRTAVLLLAIALSQPILAWGQEDFPDRFKINFGAFFVTNIDTTVSLAKTAGAVGVGARVDFEDQLGLDDSESVGRVDGYYRFGKKSRIDFSYWKIDRSDVRTVTEDISIGDIDISINSTVRTSFDTETLKVAYGFSFYNTPKVELGLLGGLHTTRMDLEIVDVTGAQSEQADGPLPLPVFGFYIRYNISPRWRFIANSQFFALSFEDAEGSLSDLRFNIEHQTWKNAGFGFGFNRIAFNLESDNKSDDLRGTFDNVNDGFLMYAFATFGKAKYQK